MIYAIDFDGTLCENKYPEIGEPRQRGINTCRQLKTKGHTLILWTCRSGKLLAAAVEWCKAQGITFDYINENTEEIIIKYGGDTRKIYADVYIDDRSLKI